MDPAQVILSWLGLLYLQSGQLILVQRGNAVIAKSRREKRIESNLCISELSQSNFEEIEEITRNQRQVRYGNWDDLWGSRLFAEEVL